MKNNKNQNKYRWTNKLSDGTYRSKGGKNKVGWNNFRNERCPTCNRKYRYFRAEINKEAYNIILQERDDPKHRRTQININQLLGKKREIKLEAWNAHKRECELVARQKAGEDISEEEMVDAIIEVESYPGYFLKTDSKTKDIMYPNPSNDDDDDIPF